MKVIFNYSNNFKEEKPSVIALGTFDGIHTGHLQLINKILHYKKNGYKTIVYTFIKHPLHSISPDAVPLQIMTLKEKILNFSFLNIDMLVLNWFNNDFMHLTPEEFILNLTSKINVKAIVVGYNYRFGFKGSGDIHLLKKLAKKYNFKVIVIGPVVKNGDVVSSSRIRSLIAEGKVDEAAVLIGRPYLLKGRINYGFGRGRNLGYPTANITPPKEKVVPKLGVYLTNCRIENIRSWGLTNVGYNPTFSKLNNLSIETYLLNFRGNIYGKPLRIEFIKMIREEKKFSSPDELIKCIKNDIKNAKNIIYNIQYK